MSSIQQRARAWRDTGLKQGQASRADKEASAAEITRSALCAVDNALISVSPTPPGLHGTPSHIKILAEVTNRHTTTTPLSKPAIYWLSFEMEKNKIKQIQIKHKLACAFWQNCELYNVTSADQVAILDGLCTRQHIMHFALTSAPLLISAHRPDWKSQQQVPIYRLTSWDRITKPHENLRTLLYATIKTIHLCAWPTNSLSADLATSSIVWSQRGG